MQIQKMFKDDINRKINGVVKVDQSAADVLEQELDEYVITKELKKHFIAFFNAFADAFNVPTSDIGVWISGFFGSGKSHLLKMLSYLLANENVNGKKTIERFRNKFEDDPATFMTIDSATAHPIETVLFNIDIEGSINKDKTAVLRVFAKMFYNHLGFYGDNLKVAMLEQYIDSLGKTEEFRRTFEEKRHMTWESQRKAFAFNGKTVVPTLMEVLDMSEEDAKAWFSDKSSVEFSIAQLVDDIKAYVAKKPKDYRLLFMVDEVGQYVGESVDLLMNLQSIVEKIGSECNGKVWVVCTGQEAIDEIIKARQNEFSRIQARFKTRLSLSSTSADEVIQERVLKKTPEAIERLESVYTANDSVMRNLFSFSNSVLDIKGFTGPAEFSRNFPFVPYQFIVMQKVFSEIRKHGNSGKHLSGGERSMLSGFQEAAQQIEMKDEFALAPFYLFYDTVHTFLDGSIRRVIDRCQKAADDGNGIEQPDVNLLKLLYLIRYVDDIPANLDNLSILLADDLRMDKIVMRDQVRKSLNRLLSQNYIGRTGDTYNFLTDEEQDIAREIKNTVVDVSTITERIGHVIFGDIYTSKKYRYENKYDFDFDQKVDGTAIGVVKGGMLLQVLTVATEATEKTEMRLMTESIKKAIVALGDTPYYESLENALKIRKYIKQHNLSQLPKSVQDIIRDQQDEAGKYESEATEQIRKAIELAQFYVDGEHIDIHGGDSKSRIDQALQYLVSHVYSELDLITKNADNDADISEILNGQQGVMPGTEPNRDAAAKMEEYLEIQHMQNHNVSMADVQARYQAIPYGWREIDVAAVTALLIAEQKVTIKYGGATIQPNNPKLPDMLRKKSEIGKTTISKRQIVTASKMKEVKSILREYFDVMDVPDDEDGLIRYIVDKFTAQQKHYEELLSHYNDHNYPDKMLVSASLSLTKDVLSQQKDNIALVDRIIKLQDDLFDCKEEMGRVEDFFKTQVTLFDSAIKFAAELRNDLEYIEKNDEANKALGQIRVITTIPEGMGKYNYKRIPELNGYISIVKDAHDEMLRQKRTDLLEVVTQCLGAIHSVTDYMDQTVKTVISKADNYYQQRKDQIAQTQSLALLDGFVTSMWNYKDQTVTQIQNIIEPKTVVPVTPPNQETKKNYRTVYRQNFETKHIETETQLEAYLQTLRMQLQQNMKGFDGIDIK